MYNNAIQEYSTLLKKRNPGKMGVRFYAAVYANLASAYARLFLFEEAADCLWKSYETVRSNEIYRRYLATLSPFPLERGLRKAPGRARSAEGPAGEDRGLAQREPGSSRRSQRPTRKSAGKRSADLPGGRETRLSQKYLCVITKSRSRKRSVFCNIQSQADFLLKV